MLISREVGLPCRSTGCARTFARRGMHNDFALLTAAAADRNEHELVEHGLVFGVARESSRPRFGDHAVFTGRGRRARIGRNLP